MLLAVSSWIYPTPVQAKTKVSLPEAKIEIKQEVITPINELLAKPQPAQVRQTNNIQPKVESVHVAIKPDNKFSGRSYTKEEVQALIIQYSQQYNINASVPLCIAKYESGYNQFSKNKSSSASGVFQYLAGTFSATDEGKAGRSVFDADANIKAAIKYMASRRSTQPWSVRNKCPNL